MKILFCVSLVSTVYDVHLAVARFEDRSYRRMTVDFGGLPFQFGILRVQQFGGRGAVLKGRFCVFRSPCGFLGGV